MKKFLKYFSIVIFILLVGVFSFNFMYPDQALFAIENQNGSYSLHIRPKEKNYLKDFALKIKKIVYHEATVHNPSGDMLPDQIDNEIIKEVKDKVN